MLITIYPTPTAEVLLGYSTPKYPQGLILKIPIDLSGEFC